MTHAIKGRSSVTHNASNVLFVIPCFINIITETSTFIIFRRCSVTEQPSGWISIAHCSVSCSQSTASISVLGTTRASITGPEKTESASEVKIHQAIGGWHLKECNRTDLLINPAWSSAEGKNAWSYNFSTPCAFMACMWAPLFIYFIYLFINSI
jgi:hypothetical protein